MQSKRPRFNPLILALALAAVLMVWSVLGGTGSANSSSMEYSTVVHYFESLQVTQFSLDLNTGVITMNLKEGGKNNLPLPDTTSQSTTQATGGLLSGMLSSSDEDTAAQKNSDGTVTVRYKLPYASMFVKYVGDYIAAYDAANPDAPMVYDYTPVKENIPWMEILFYLAMLGCTGFLLFSMMRGGAGGGGIMNVGKAKVKDEHENQKTATFADVAGEDEEKEELKEVVEFLKSPEKFNTLGARIPHGVLLVGPPGTGKTMLAKAVAGESNVPFFSISGSEFVEMFVGMGASKVRDLFRQAKEKAPCIVFIDEIDAIGQKRNSGNLGGNDEREQTLNQLLAEMDGFDTSKGLLILAATNRPEVLDKALLRPGRFDRRIIVDKPDLKGRLETLKVHSKDVLMDETVDLDALALATAGLVGSDLANMINEAAINAVKKGRKYVNQADLFEAFELVAVGGKEKKDRVMSDKERKIVSYHEVGHAIVTALQKNTEPVQKITIVPRTMGALGYTLQTPEEEKFLQTKDELLAKITTYMAGRAAEVLVFSSATSGAANDIENATAIARAMVTQYGMSDKFGMMCLATTENQYLDNRAGLICGEETAAQIDGEVLSIINKCYDDAMQLLIENRESLDKISEYLYEHETITGKEFMKIFREIKGIPEPEEESTKKSFMEQAMDAERQSKGNDGE